MTSIHSDARAASEALAAQGTTAPPQTVIVTPLLANVHQQMVRLYSAEGRGAAPLSCSEAVDCLRAAGSTASNPSTTFRLMVRAGLLSESGERSNRYRVPIMEGTCVQATKTRGHASTQAQPTAPANVPIEEPTQARLPSARMAPALKAVQTVFAHAKNKPVSAVDLFAALKEIGWKRPAEAVCYFERSGQLKHVSGTKKSRRDPPYFELVDGTIKVAEVGTLPEEVPVAAKSSASGLRSREALVEELALLDKELERASQAEIAWTEAPVALMRRLEALQAELDATRAAYEAHIATPDPKIEIRALGARRKQLRTVIESYTSIVALLVS